MPRHPHILLICTDEQAPQYMGCMGDPIARTPNLDRLAARGALFRNAYCNNPICVPGRYSILTGRYVRELGSLEYGSGLDPRAWTYPKHFARAGYQTTCVGKQHFMGLEQMHGWMFRPYGDMELDRHFGRPKIPGFAGDPLAGTLGPIPGRPPGNLAGWVRTAGPSDKGFANFDRMTNAAALLHLQDYFQPVIMGEYEPDRPLLFEVSYKCPHWPFWAPKDLFDHYRNQVSLPRIPPDEPGNFFLDGVRQGEAPFANTPDEILNARAANYALIELVDRRIGEILQCAQDLGILDDMLVLMHCDHGEMNGNHGCWGKGRPYEHSARVPLLVSFPGAIPAGTVIDTPVSNVDIFPTLCDYAGIDTPPDLRGESLRGLIDATASQRPPTSQLPGEQRPGGQRPGGQRPGEQRPGSQLPSEQRSGEQRLGDQRPGGPADLEHWRSRPIISEFFNFRRGWAMVRRGNLKYVDYWGHPDNEFPLDVWDRTGWQRATQLFDLARDPDELTNLAADPAHAATCDDLQSILDVLPTPHRWNEPADTRRLEP